MTSKLAAIVLHTTRKVYPVAHFVRYQGDKRISREYRMTGQRAARLTDAGAKFVLGSEPGWMGCTVFNGKALYPMGAQPTLQGLHDKRAARPPAEPITKCILEVTDMAALVYDAVLAAHTHKSKLDPRAQELDIRVGALQAHLALAFRAANNLLQDLDNLKGGAHAEDV